MPPSDDIIEGNAHWLPIFRFITIRAAELHAALGLGQSLDSSRPPFPAPPANARRHRAGFMTPAYELQQSMLLTLPDGPAAHATPSAGHERKMSPPVNDAASARASMPPHMITPDASLRRRKICDVSAPWQAIKAGNELHAR